MAPPVFTTAFLHPRYWMTWVFLGLMVLLAQLPYRLQMVLGVLTGNILYRFAKRRRMIAETNIALCFSELNQQERDALVQEHFRTNGIAMFETAMAWFMPYWRLRKRFVVSGVEYWQALQDRGRGALVIGTHLNSLEICNMQVSRLFDFHCSYRAHNNPVYDFIQHRGRERNSTRSAAIDRYDIRGMVRALKAGGFLWYAPDQDYGRKVSEFVPWFGVSAATVSATPRLLKMAGVCALGIRHRRLPGYKGYEIEFMPPLEGIPSGDNYTDLVMLNGHIEECIKYAPAEYLWVHRRFKTRPAGEPTVYDGAV